MTSPGRCEWLTSSGYSKRCKAENTVLRNKMMIGRSMRSRTFDGQRVGVQLACQILNTMTHLGMPDNAGFDFQEIWVAIYYMA